MGFIEFSEQMTKPGIDKSGCRLRKTPRFGGTISTHRVKSVMLNHLTLEPI